MINVLENQWWSVTSCYDSTHLPPGVTCTTGVGFLKTYRLYVSQIEDSLVFTKSTSEKGICFE